MSNLKHSPLPWRIHKLPSGELEILSINGRCILNMYDWGNEHQDAQFIVTACNYHERLKNVLSEQDQLLAWAEDIAHGKLSEAITNQRRGIQAVLKELEEQK